jgi:ubiquinone/menaquinone biosynthesis C-methylase UbiE
MLASVQSPGATLVGADLDRALVAVARSQYWGVRHVSFVEADVYDLPFEAGSFDFVHARWRRKRISRHALASGSP